MGRLRNASRIWANAPELATTRVMVACDGPYFTVDPLQLFANRAPLEVEIGAGRGDFLIERAAQSPSRNFLAIESVATFAQLIAMRAGRWQLANLRVIRMDARPLVNLMLPRASVDAYHIYFPDPWPKERQAKHRLFTPQFTAGLARTLKPEAPLFVATDVAAYANEIFAMLLDGGFRPIEMPAPGAALTGFARKFQAEGRPIHGGAFNVAPAPASP
ncbi:MAG: tRNA (guanosine(46)-N7)-methyltransferase TrmB [Candidatus Binataceae bacterium]|jgi:tRNA (guanine-N7-)-methyltransferase